MFYTAAQCCTVQHMVGLIHDCIFFIKTHYIKLEGTHRVQTHAVLLLSVKLALT